MQSFPCCIDLCICARHFSVGMEIKPLTADLSSLFLFKTLFLSFHVMMTVTLALQGTLIVSGEELLYDKCFSCFPCSVLPQIYQKLCTLCEGFQKYSFSTKLQVTVQESSGVISNLKPESFPVLNLETVRHKDVSEKFLTYFA